MNDLISEVLVAPANYLELKRINLMYFTAVDESRSAADREDEIFAMTCELEMIARSLPREPSNTADVTLKVPTLKVPKVRKVIDEADLIGLLKASFALRESYMADFFVSLNGNGKSSKDIELVDEEPLIFCIYNYIDDTEETLSGADWAGSFTHHAVTNQALYCQDSELLQYEAGQILARAQN